MSGPSGKPIPWLWYILGVALLVRSSVPLVAYFYTRDITIFHAPDTASYVEPARQLIAHGRFSAGDGTPEIIRTPGYPMLLIFGLLLGSGSVSRRLKCGFGSVREVFRFGFF